MPQAGRNKIRFYHSAYTDVSLKIYKLFTSGIFFFFFRKPLLIMGILKCGQMKPWIREDHCS